MTKKTTLLILIIIGASILYFGGQYVHDQYDKYKINKYTEEQKTKNQAEQMSAMQATITELQNKKPETITKIVEHTNTVTKEVAVKDGYSTEEIVKQWSPKTAYVLCSWNYVDDTTFTNPYLIASGSGMVETFSDGTTEIVTNAHVMTDNEGYGPTGCLVKIPGYEDIFVNYKDVTVYENVDLAYVNIQNPSQDLVALGQNNPACFENVSVGEKLVILGYPGTGSNSGVTVTDGIISGNDGNYYITSAKIEHGNSGGLAISLKNNCYIGIPTSSVVGSIESLGRILSSSYIFSN
jgi:S1-C subfamily serine protease